MKRKNVKRLMTEYFNSAKPQPYINELISPRSTTVPDELPISVKDGADWKMIDNPTQRLVRAFKFDNRRALMAFINEVIEYENEVNHHGEITIEGYVVKISVYTHKVNLVTEIDLEYTRTVSEIKRDVDYYSTDSELEIEYR